MMVAFYVGCGAVAHRRGAGADALGARRRSVRARRIRRHLSSGRHRDGDRDRRPARPHARLQRRLRQSRRLARRRHDRGADRGIVLARRLPGAGPDLSRHRRRFICGSFPTRRGTRRHATPRPTSACPNATAAILFGLFVVVALSRGARVQHIVGRVAENRRRACQPDISLLEVGGLTTGGIHVRGDCATRRRPAGRAHPPHILFAATARHAVHRRGVDGLCERRHGAVRARLHHGGDLRPDHGQRSHHRALHRRRLARPGVRRALLPDLHDFRRGGVDDRVAVRPRRLRPGARRHRGRRARLPDRGAGDRLYRQRRGEGAGAATVPAE